MIKTEMDLTKKQEEPKSNGTNRKAAEVKLDRKPTKEIPAVIPPELSIEEKIQKVQDLNDLIAKRNRFHVAKSKLNSFNLKREDTTTQVIIQDKDGNQFVTSQTDAIEKILSVLDESIEKGLTETEAKIQF